MIIYICLMAVMAYLAFRWGKETKAGTCHMMKEYTEKKEMAGAKLLERYKEICEKYPELSQAADTDWASVPAPPALSDAAPRHGFPRRRHRSDAAGNPWFPS